MGIKVYPGQHVWQLGVALPKDEHKGRRYVENRTITVVAPTPDRAIECVREHYGTCSVWSVQHRACNDHDLIVASEVFDDSSRLP